MKSLSIVRFYNDNPKKNTQIFGAIDEKENVIGEIELENEEGFIDSVNIYVDLKARRKGVGTYLLQSVLNYLCEISLFLIEGLCCRYLVKMCINIIQIFPQKLACDGVSESCGMYLIPRKLSCFIYLVCHKLDDHIAVAYHWKIVIKTYLLMSRYGT